MARGIQLKECKYEIDIFVGANKVRTVLNICYIHMDKFNVGTADNKIKESGSAITPIPFNISLRKNEREIGIHPRHVICRREETGSASACYGVKPKRLVMIPVLTLAQFNTLQEYDLKLGGTQPNTTIRVNHSNDGTAFLDYTIIHKVDQFML
ncbi:hypothetical protein [Pseudanabaena sp. 'Roaring Creek']|uniref:hypothetical protein n=1 Tax=Pseudanabaena sp. 'Roaring Creek' TaxID=1681830 RepID=UPI0006D7B3DD|nr:hypothetical protein [Pseudanabaena sp. 'Roaring Creek']